ncbi:aldehyde dehydrogenase (NADP(+)) [Beijerinckia indica]|uniref:2,5-dioxovalerate dehydrogenase n=1 Tax=Beijerinckia indica subsp. indica (strain ATCC 9039 / DSM 1715 / NCIMB 8712) TaxID=395963 RepID=B2IBL3_BEII9|nr:aldehyde dehydrogenase (NADP(+)) [Beijerinckia indica]ACB96639.1 Aldehyde Dehydrogenase [Beijerinckia indica subsp. indica ATCC 9039]
MAIKGESLIGSRDVSTVQTFHAVNPATGLTIEPPFAEAGEADVEAAAQLAAEAFPIFRETTPSARAAFLEAIADAIEAIGDELIDRAMQETGLPKARLTGERGRTTGQLRLFSTVLRRGDWVDARIDPALPKREPLPRSDLRMRQIGVGPVAVFGASNFPLAFSVAGGDTASALAAGCPVVVKGHPAHPGTSELVGRAVRSAVEASGLPEGVFSLLSGTSHTLGTSLVADPRIMAVGFTGSRGGGLALSRIAAQRPVPIPVYAEMSSINPVFLLPGALAARADQLGTAFVGSLTLGAGQFCTNPGVAIGIAGVDFDRFIAAAAVALGGAPAAAMLTPGIADAYQRGVDALAAQAAVEELARGTVPNGPNACRPALFTTDAKAFCATSELSHEVFGASSLIVRCADKEEMQAVARALEGQLTATLHLESGDETLARTLLPVLDEKAGRILANGWPTGVEVCDAMVHGGPFPATSDPRTTSVGTLAIRRFLRPVCYQDLPPALLPPALQPDNPLGLPRLVNGKTELGGAP